MSKFKHVFSPIKIGNFELKNRIATAPMLPCLATPDGCVTREMIEYYQGYARGGAAIVNLGDTCVDSEYGRGHYGELDLSSDRVIGGLSNVAEAIHKFGAMASVELNHPGRMAQPKNINWKKPVAPSPIPAKGEIIKAKMEGREPVKITEMDQDMIDKIIAKFVDACSRCVTAGFGIVMLHGGHGQLLSQFVSPYSNKRTDKYGGSPEKRATFVIELLNAIREKLGNSLAIEYRISADEIAPEGMHIDETIEFIKLIQDKIDLVHASVGMLSDPELIPYMAQPAYFPRAYNASRAEKIKQAVKIPVVCVGSVLNLEIAEKIIAEGKADIVAMGRAHIADPDIVNKSRRGELDEIRPCIRCNMCGERIPYSLPIRCTVNPVIGREIEHKNLPLPKKKKKVVIIGGGPAGMLAAITASSRGHNVILYEKEKNLGGAIIMAASPSFKLDMKEYLDWLVRKTKKSQTDIRMSTTATPHQIKSENPDAVIVAAGAEPILPDIPGVKNSNVAWAGDVDTGKAQTGQNVAVIGAGMTGCETALHLVQQGKKITLVDMLSESEFAKDASGVSRMTLLEMLHKENVEFVTQAKLKEISAQGTIVIDTKGKLFTIPADTVVLSLGVKPRTETAKQFLQLAPDVYIIGDCRKVGNLKNAIHDAFNVAVEI